jgi:tetratricopeptide (TPR) repeat protein
MTTPARTKATAAAIAVVCMALVIPTQMRIDSMRAKLVTQNVMPTQMPLQAAAAAALGGFRGLAVDILWIQSDNMINDRQFYQLMTYYKIISTLQPNFPSVWTYNAWNLAYNISFEWNQPEEKWLWVKKGLEFAKEGLKYNSDSEEINFFLGFMYLDKIADDPYFAAKVQEEEGVEPYLKAYEYFKKTYDLIAAQGDTDVRSGSACMLALYQHGEFLRKAGNVPEAMRFYAQALAGTMALEAQYPEDAAVQTLRARIDGRVAEIQARLAR